MAGAGSLGEDRVLAGAPPPFTRRRVGQTCDGGALPEVRAVRIASRCGPLREPSPVESIEEPDLGADVVLGEGGTAVEGARRNDVEGSGADSSREFREGVLGHAPRTRFDPSRSVHESDFNDRPPVEFPVRGCGRRVGYLHEGPPVDEGPPYPPAGRSVLAPTRPWESVLGAIGVVTERNNATPPVKG